MLNLKQLPEILLFSTTLLFASYAPAQNWTWVHGDSIPNQSGIYGANAPEFKPGARIHGATWTDNDGNLWLFGGLGYSSSGAPGQLNDLWKYDPQTNCWSWVGGSSGTYQQGAYNSQGSFSSTACPGARTNAVSWTDPSGNLWLYGGLGISGGVGVIFSDLWKYSPATGNWAWMRGTWSEAAVYGTIAVPASSNTPGERCHSTSWTDDAGNLWLFGGNTSFNFTSDLWKYDPSVNEWTWIHGSDLADQPGIYGLQGIPDPAARPGARSQTFCFKDKNNRFWLFGGYGYSGGGNPGYLNDLWRYDPSANQWTWINGTAMIDQAGTYGTQGSGNPGTMPGGRMHTSGWVDSAGNVWAFGGMGYASTVSGWGVERMNDLWKYDPLSNTWTWAKGSNGYNALSTYGQLLIPDPANTPGARSDFMTWSGEHGLWLFGGNGWPGSPQQSFGYQNDLWRFGSDTLHFIAPPISIAGSIEMPNVFSPNGDDLNEVFTALQLPPSASYELIILNRWGEPVFQTTDPGMGWDGASNGEPCMPGVYFWTVKLGQSVGAPMTTSGFVTLLR